MVLLIVVGLVAIVEGLGPSEAVRVLTGTPIVRTSKTANHSFLKYNKFNSYLEGKYQSP